MIQINPGDRFGRLTIIKQVPRPETCHTDGKYYLCKCDCGNEKIVCAKHLRNGSTKSCGCLSRETASKNNCTNIPINSKFGKLTVLGRAPIKGNAKAYWTCQCDCGNIVDIRGEYLLNGHTKSCGCLRKKNLIDETGKRYGKLVVIEYVGSRDNATGAGALWKCRCDCGKEFIARGDSLRDGTTTSCGCVKSRQEELLASLLEDSNIDFVRQYTFSDLKSNKKRPLRFDFGIMLNNKLFCLIEYQGTQHYDTNSSWYSEEAVERDQLKRDYCNNKNIQLFELNNKTNLQEFIEHLKQEMN